MPIGLAFGGAFPELARADALSKAQRDKMSPGQIIQLMKDGNERFRKGERKQRPFRVIKIALELPREVLYERINHRVDIMMQDGLLDEVKSLKPYSHLKNLQTVGYSELFEYLDRKCTLDEAVDKIKQHTRNYAKRQLTWFRKDKEYSWFDAADKDITGKLLSLGK